MIREMVLGNPVLIKHVRSRLRMQHLLPLIAIVITICICIAWAAAVGGDQQGAAISILVVQALVLFLVGGATVATAVSNARESGMLDFHRISPQEPAAVTLGFLLGAPIREYILFACTLPFSLLIATEANHSLLGWLAVTADLIVASLLYYAIAILAGLALPKRTSSMTITVLIIAMLHMGWMLQASGCMTIVPTALSAFAGPGTPFPFRTTVFGLPMPAFLVSLLHQVPILVFLLLAAARKMRHELAYPLSKLDAVMFFLVFALLLVADAPSSLGVGREFNGGAELGIPAFAYGLLLFGALLTVLVTPNAGAFTRGIRHARKLGSAEPSLWSDRAPNFGAVAAFGVIFAGAGVVASAFTPHTLWPAAGTVVAAVIGGCAVLFWGLAKQSFDLIFRRNSNSYFMLLVFVCWVLPLILGLLIGAMVNDERSASYVLAMSPLSSIGLLLTTWRSPTAAVNTSIALTVNVALVLIFAVISMQATRRATAEVSEGRSGGEPAL
jgi:hypothetical protein